MPCRAIIARSEGEMTPLVGLHENFVVLDYDNGMKEEREGIPKIMKKLTP